MLSETLLSLFSLLIVATGQPADNEKPVRPSIRALRVEKGPVVDGRLDDAVWADAPVGGGLRQYEPLQGVPMTERTEFRFVYDDDNLYIGIWCYDREPEKIIARVMARDDRASNDDSIFMAFDTFLDRRNGYVFNVNANGARRDFLVSDNTRLNEEWDAIWTARGSIDDEGWKVEIALPFKSLAFDPDSDTWGFNMSRTIKRKSERGRWSRPTPDIRTYNVGEAGLLTGLSGLKQGVGLDLVPYVLGRYTEDRAASDDDFDLEAGGDIRYRLAPNLTALLSYNTDFAETEVDRRQINLTRFPLFFPEKRDFFLEDAGIFGFGGLGRFSRRRRVVTGSRPPDLLPFFSRRIGLSEIDGNGGQEVVPIVVAGKVTGRVGPYNIGLVDALLDDHDELGQRNALVARVSRNVFEQSSVGGIFTHGDPNTENDNLLAGTDFSYRNTSFLGRRILEGNAFAMGTYSEDAKDEVGWAYGGNVSLPSDRYQASIEFLEIAEGFNPALGFAPRRGIRSYGSAVGYHPRPESIESVRQLFFVYRNRFVTDLSNDLETALHSFVPLYLFFESSDELYWQTDYELDAPDEDFEISDGVIIPAGDYWWLSHTIGFDTASKRIIRARFEYKFGEFYTGDRQRFKWDLEFLSWKHLGMSFDYALDLVRLPEGDFDARLAGARMQWNFTTDFIWFHLLQYDSDSESVGYHSRIRWEFRPGNFLFLVLNQNFDRDGSRLDLQQSEVVAKLGLTIRF